MAARTNFRQLIRTDLKMGLKFPLIFAILGVTMGFCFDNLSDLLGSFNNPLIYTDGSVISIIYYVFNAFSFGGVFSSYFATIMAAIPFSMNYCQEHEGHLSMYKITRCGHQAYVLSKFIVATTLGGVTLFLGSLVFIAALGTYLPIVTPMKIFESYGIPFYDALSIWNGAAYLAIVLYINFLNGALWASVSLCVSAFCPNCYVAVCAPFVFRFVLTQIGRLLKLSNGLRLEMLLCARGMIISDAVTLTVTTVMVVALIFLCYRLFAKQIERSIWNVE